MSLNQKYTWADFLREHPEFKTKKIKRMSSEGKKAFEAAFKKYIKGYLEKRSERIETIKKRATGRRAEIAKKQQELVQSKNRPRAKIAQKAIGRQDAWLARLEKQSARTKALQKNF